MTVSFEKDSVGYTNLAVYVSELVRQGVTFKIDEYVSEVRVTLTGGYQSSPQGKPALSISSYVSA